MKLEDLVLDELQNDEKLRQHIRGIATEVTKRMFKSQEQRIKLMLDQAVDRVYATDIEKLIKDSVKEVISEIVRKRLGNGNGNGKEKI